MIARLSNFISSIIKLSLKIWIIWNVVFKDSWWPFENLEVHFEIIFSILPDDDSAEKTKLPHHAFSLYHPDVFLQKYFGRRKFTDCVQNFFTPKLSLGFFSLKVQPETFRRWNFVPKISIYKFFFWRRNQTRFLQNCKMSMEIG